MVGGGKVKLIISNFNFSSLGIFVLEINLGGSGEVIVFGYMLFFLFLIV